MKKILGVIFVVALIIGVWIFSRSHNNLEQQGVDVAKNVSDPASASKQKGADWPKSAELNQKLAAKNVVHEIGATSEPVSSVPEPEIKDERIGKENPSMIEHPKAEDLPPLDMMSTEEQIKFNKEIIMTPEEYEAAKKKISEAEILPDVTELQKQVDIEVAADKAKAEAARQQKR